MCRASSLGHLSGVTARSPSRTVTAYPAAHEIVGRASSLRRPLTGKGSAEGNSVTSFHISALPHLTLTGSAAADSTTWAIPWW